MLGGSLFFGEPLGSVSSYYYFLKELPDKVSNSILKIQNLWVRSMFFYSYGGSSVLGFKFFLKGVGPGNC